MMKAAGIIAEYNPFHNGHRYLAERTRASGATHIVAVMSGSFVQRGEPAILSKWERTETALKNGVDLVLELPVSYALSSAERFAAGGVATLAATGCVNLLSFGSESGDIAALKKAADACRTAEKSEQIALLLKEGLSYPTARERAVELLSDPETAALLSSPNNTLGIAYLKALSATEMTPMTVSREGGAHDGIPEGGYASASWIRKQLIAGEDATCFLPDNVEISDNLADSKRLDAAVLYRLRGMSVKDFARLPDVTEGLENRLYAAAQEATDVEDFLFRVKTKRYPLARLRRILWCGMIGIEKEDVITSPSYLRILGMNDRGKELLQQMKSTATLPIVSGFPELSALSPRFASLEKAATDLQGLAFSPLAPCNRDYTEKLIVL